MPGSEGKFNFLVDTQLKDPDIDDIGSIASVDTGVPSWISDDSNVLTYSPGPSIKHGSYIIKVTVTDDNITQL